jgi:hypothetical protein
MDCCKGMGGAMKDSCPIMRLKGVRRTELKQADPICRAGALSSASGKATHGHHTAHMQTLFVGGMKDIKDVSSRDSPAHAMSSLASVSQPCPSDCCCQTNSLTRTQRPRDEAAISNKLRPRPPTSGVVRQVSRAVRKGDSEARRQYPPRAPPASL